MNKITAKDILEPFKQLLLPLFGDLQLQVSGPDNSDSALENVIIYLNSEKSLSLVNKSKPKVVIINPKYSAFAEEHLKNCTVFTCKNVMLAMALINERFYPVTLNKGEFNHIKLHPTAVIDPSAEIGEGTIINPNAVIHKGVRVGKGCFIGANTVVEAGTSLGDNTHLHAQVFIGLNTQIGANCEVQPNSTIGTAGYGYAPNEKGEHMHIPHYGKVILEDRVQIGANTSIDRSTYGDTLISEGTKIDNHCHIAHNFKVGKNSLITAGFITAGSVTIGSNFVAGGRTSINGHITICDNVQLAANTTATKSIVKSGNYAGYPIQLHRDAIRSIALIASLPEMKKTLTKLKNKFLV